jgi:signal transduction histidine kinase
MRPHVLESGDLAASLRSMASQLVAGTALHAEVRVVGSGGSIPQAVEDQFFRVGQEALTNAVKHAGCASLRLGLAYRAGGLEMTVADDGRGFVPTAAPASAEAGGYGILGMRERMAQIGGELNIESEPGRGTKVIARWDPGEVPSNGERRSRI